MENIESMKDNLYVHEVRISKEIPCNNYLCRLLVVYPCTNSRTERVLWHWLKIVLEKMDCIYWMRREK